MQIELEDTDFFAGFDATKLAVQWMWSTVLRALFNKVRDDLKKPFDNEILS